MCTHFPLPGASSTSHSKTSPASLVSTCSWHFAGLQTHSIHCPFLLPFTLLHTPPPQEGSIFLSRDRAGELLRRWTLDSIPAPVAGGGDGNTCSSGLSVPSSLPSCPPHACLLSWLPLGRACLRLCSTCRYHHLSLPTSLPHLLLPLGYCRHDRHPSEVQKGDICVLFMEGIMPIM